VTLRIALVNWSSRLAGGAEAYISSVIPALDTARHQIAMLCELDVPANHAPLQLPPNSPKWDMSAQGPVSALADLQAWHPDALFMHGLHNPQLERRLLEIAPVVFLAHTYYGACVSGEKTFKFPDIRPCNRQFGVACLPRYYPRHCGGLDPMTMARMFRVQSARLNNLKRYHTVLTLSEHMRSEYMNYRLPDTHVQRLPLPTPVGYGSEILEQRSARVLDLAEQGCLRLLFIGRMDVLKGGRVALDAIQHIRRQLQLPVHFTLIGDGPDRSMLDMLARRVMESDPVADVRILGWCDRNTVRSQLDDTHVLVVPSLLPEPLGLVGLEAQFHALPVAAFAVGGIPEWLCDGVNGHLAPSDPPTARALADAVTACVTSADHYAKLSQGALEVARKLDSAAHAKALNDAMSSAVKGDT
jgi:glycosyltransferase involved in cell wall biosynthesis